MDINIKKRQNKIKYSKKDITNIMYNNIMKDVTKRIFKVLLKNILFKILLGCCSRP
jgi:hypothetical protein